MLTESLQMRSAPLYDAVVVTGELSRKGVTCKVRREGGAGQLFAPQVSSPLISIAAAGAERGRNILSDRGEQAGRRCHRAAFRQAAEARRGGSDHAPGSGRGHGLGGYVARSVRVATH